MTYRAKCTDNKDVLCTLITMVGSALRLGRTSHAMGRRPNFIELCHTLDGQPGNIYGVLLLLETQKTFGIFTPRSRVPLYFTGKRT